MKSTRILTFWPVVATLLLGDLAATAMPPIPHSISGNIQRIDRDRRELTVTNATERLVLTWSESARLDRTCLQPGDPVKAWHRKEMGRFVIRDLRSENACDSSTCCKN